jgi:hypothetical protein
MPQKPSKKVANLGFTPRDEYGYISPYRATVNRAALVNDSMLFPESSHSPEEFAPRHGMRQQANDLHNARLIAQALRLQDARERAAGGVPLRDEAGYISPYRQSLMNAEEAGFHPGNLLPGRQEMERRRAIQKAMSLREALMAEAAKRRR